MSQRLSQTGGMSHKSYDQSAMPDDLRKRQRTKNQAEVWSLRPMFVHEPVTHWDYD
jgi:hypothetical protein